MNNNSISEFDIFALCQSEQKFPVDFELAWRWIGYSRKDNAKVALLSCGFTEGIDLLMNQELGTLDVPNPSEHITLTVDCLKTWAMMANTEKGREVRLYFLECERKLKQLVFNAPQPQLKPIDIFNLDQKTLELLEAWMRYRKFPSLEVAWEEYNQPGNELECFVNPDRAAMLDDRLKAMPDFAIMYLRSLWMMDNLPLNPEYLQKVRNGIGSRENALVAQQFQAQLDRTQLAAAPTQKQLG